MEALLAERDRRMRNGDYFRSRRLAIATTVLPVAAATFGKGLPEGLWEHDDKVLEPLRDLVDTFFLPLHVPRFISARASDALMNVPRFYDFNGDNRRRLLRHPEYRYSRELLSLTVTACDWDKAVLEEWPSEGTGPRRTRKRPRGRRRKKRPPEEPQ